MWQRAVDTQRFNPRFRNDEWRHRITGGHPDRVVLTYVGRLGAGAALIAVHMDCGSITLCPAAGAADGAAIFSLWRSALKLRSGQFLCR